MKNQSKQSWRTWKSGKQWLAASSVLVALAAAGFAGTSAAHADTAHQKNPAKIAEAPEQTAGITENTNKTQALTPTNSSTVSSSGATSKVSSADSSSSLPKTADTKDLSSAAVKTEIPSESSDKPEKSVVSDKVSEKSPASEKNIKADKTAEETLHQAKVKQALPDSTPKVNEVVHNYDELYRAIAWSPMDGSEYRIEIVGEIVGGSPIIIGQNKNIFIYGGKLVAVDRPENSMTTFWINGNGALTLDHVTIDASARPINGIIKAQYAEPKKGPGDLSPALTLRDTEIKGVQGGDSQHRSYAVLSTYLRHITLSGNTSISNFNTGIIVGVVRETGRIVMKDSAIIKHNKVGIEYMSKARSAQPISMSNKASLVDNGVGILLEGQAPFNLLGDGSEVKISHSQKAAILLLSQGDMRYSIDALIQNINFEDNQGEATVQASLDEKSKLAITDCRFSDNRGKKSGGVYFKSNGELNLAGCKFSKNVSEGNGGAVAIQPGSHLEIKDTTFTSNEAAQAGGAIGFYKNDQPCPNDDKENENQSLGNITANINTVFQGNHASSLMHVSPEDKAKHDDKIQSQEFSSLNNAYNNYDIQYYHKDPSDQIPNTGSDSKETTSQEPVAGSDSEGTTVQEPVTGSDSEGTTAQEPAAGSNSEGTTAQKPVSGPDSEGTTVQEPVAGSDSEGTTVQKPGSGSTSKDPSDQMLGTSSDSKANSDQKPAADSNSKETSKQKSDLATDSKETPVSKADSESKTVSESKVASDSKSAKGITPTISSSNDKPKKATGNTLKVTNSARNNQLPSTGETSNVGMYLGFLVLFTAGALVYGVEKKAKRRDK